MKYVQKKKLKPRQFDKLYLIQCQEDLRYAYLGTIMWT